MKALYIILIGFVTTNAYAADSIIQTSIAVNQIGYVNKWPKSALLINSLNPDQEVLLVNEDTDDELLKIKPTRQKLAQSGVMVQLLDFSEIVQNGRYYLKQNDLRSASFVIDAFPFNNVNYYAMRSYYLQRCGVKISDSSGLSHEACHLEDAVVANDDSSNRRGKRLQASGGWHDAGDFGKYIAPASAAVNRLLSLYENNPSFFLDNQLNIPESGNGISDILDEVKVELEWMLSMQRQDGGVYRKLSGAHWPNVGSPDLDNQHRFVYGVSSPETAKFAASLAIAGRVFREVDIDTSERYLKASESAWRWLEAESKQFVDAHPDDDNGSGKYLLSQTDQEKSLTSDIDDRLAAAIELYLTTNKNEYFSYIEENIADANYTLFEWKDISTLSLYHLMQKDKTLASANIRKGIRNKLIDRAKNILKTTIENPYGLANIRFVWGSNKMTAEEGITLVNAYQITKNKAYLKAAIAQLDYLLGKNPLAISYVSGAGDNAVKFPNHLHARSIKALITGFMVGGPNSIGQDNITPKNLGALSYIDNDHAYSSNEYAIDYNSAFIGLVVSLRALSDDPLINNNSGEQHRMEQ
jgi:Glycosyl hydrolase family 9/Cellulase N-terminal ig-like domain